jgi:hypothetical protein
MHDVMDQGERLSYYRISIPPFTALSDDVKERN